MNAVEVAEALSKVGNKDAEVKIALRNGVIPVGEVIDKGDIVFLSPEFDCRSNKKTCYKK